MNKNRFREILRRIYGSTDQFELEIDRKLWLLNIIHTIGIVFLIPYIFISYAQGSYLLSLFDLIAVILMVLMFIHVHHTREYQLAVYFSITFLGGLFFYVMFTGGVNNTGPLWTYVFPMLLMFLLGIKRGTIVYAAFYSLILLMFFLPGNFFLLTIYTRDFKLRFLTTHLIVFMISFFVEWVREKTQEKTIRKTNELEKALNHLNQIEEERSRLQNKLIAAQKMEALGVLAGGMAHELNNQVAIVNGNTDLLLPVLSDDEQFRKKLKAIQAAAQRIAALTQQLLSFSRQQFLQLESINLNELIKQNYYSFHQALGKDTELLLNLDTVCGNINADSGLILELIMEIVFNARDAMPNGGKFLIKTENVRVENHPVMVDPPENQERYLCLTLQDTGTGMDNETAQKIFDPFFTTKKVGEGMGLGLSSAFGIAQQHNGWIEVSSEPGKGTTFKVFLPLPF